VKTIVGIVGSARRLGNTEIEMKDRFAADKKRLKQISIAYRGDGRWVEPNR
jgi:hypothetical protein